MFNKQFLWAKHRER